MSMKGRGIWKERAIPLWVRWAALKPVMFVPSKTMVPASGFSTPVMSESSVDLPAPFGPTMPSAVPRSTENDRSSAVTTLPNRFERPLTSRIGATTAPFVRRRSLPTT